MATTIRLQPQTRNRLKDRNITSLNSLVEKLLNRWADDPSILDPQKVLEPHSRPTTKQLRQEIANSIARHLQENQDWITDVILDAQLYREGESIFGDRIDHFLEEKQFLAEKFVPWLLKRILWYLNQGRSVVLVLDSGTSVYWIFRQLGPKLVSIASTEPVLEKKLVLVTNNIPGVDFYMTLSRLKPFRPPRYTSEVGLSDYINCTLLSGTVLTKYAALTGRDAEVALRHQRDAAPDAVFLGLVAGNWIRIDNGDPHHPIPLARGDQVEFKQVLIDVCDELYVPVPLGKVFVTASEDDINQGLRYSNGQGGDKNPYRQVPIRADMKKRIKLVSSSRPSGLLYTHSEVVRNTYLVGSHNSYDAVVTDSIEEIPTMLFQFDKLAGRPLAKQMEIEFPHTYTRHPIFMQKYFSVPAPA